MVMELKYFDGPGRAATLRILLHAAKLGWKDTYVTFNDFSALKPSLPLGCLPTVTMDGTQFCQSIALQRYVAKKIGLYPADDKKALIVDEMMDTLNECFDKCPYTGTEEEKKVSRPAYQKNVMTPYFALVESRIQAFGNGATVCGDFSVADIHLMTVVDFFESGFMDYLDLDFFKNYPGVKAVAEKTKQHELVTAYKASVEKK